MLLRFRCLRCLPSWGVTNLLFPVVRLVLDVLVSSSDESESVRSITPPVSLLVRSTTSFPELLEFLEFEPDLSASSSEVSVGAMITCSA